MRKIFKLWIKYETPIIAFVSYYILFYLVLLPIFKLFNNNFLLWLIITIFSFLTLKLSNYLYKLLLKILYHK
jgi:hypothetical protein